MNDVVRNRASETISLHVSKGDGPATMVLPADVLVRLNLNDGDRLYLIEEPSGTLLLSPFDQDYLETMRIADRVMDKYRETFEALAK